MTYGEKKAFGQVRCRTEQQEGERFWFAGHLYEKVARDLARDVSDGINYGIPRDAMVSTEKGGS